MRLIKPSFEFITNVNGEQILKEIEIAARTCYKSEDRIEYDNGVLEEVNYDNPTSYRYVDFNRIATSARKLIPNLIASKHFAMLEFGSNIHVKIVCDRGVSHELVRHRIASFAQESTRYCNYGKEHHITYIIPCWLNIEEGIYSCNEYRDIDDANARYWAECMYNTEHWYHEFISKNIGGWTPQQARSVLPNSLKTEINISCNLREWRHIFIERTAKAAHPQMREIMIPLLAEFKKKIPIIFDDIIVNL